MKPEAPSQRRSRRVTAVCALGAALIAALALLTWAFGQWHIGTFGEGYVPMSPSTAWLMILLGGALAARDRWPGNRAAVAFSFLAVCVVAVFCGLALSPWASATSRVVERWLAGPETTRNGIAVGRISPVTALSFLGAALALLAGLPPLQRLQRSRSVAVILAFGIIVTGLIMIAGYAAGMPILYGSAFVPMALMTAVAFLLLGFALLFSVGRNAWPLRMFGEEGPALPQRSRRFAWLLTGILVFTVTTIGVVGFFYLKCLDNMARWDAEEDVATVADLKISQIVNWRKERLGDAHVFFHASFAAGRIRDFLASPSRADLGQEITDWLASVQQSYDYERVVLLDPQLNARLSAPPSNAAIGAPGCQLAQEALRSRRVMFSDLHRSSENGHIHLDMAVPLLLREQTSRRASDDAGISPEVAGQPPVGVVLFQINPHKFLYPLIQSWPTPSETAETLLVRREGNDVLFLNELRHRRGTAMALRHPISQPDLPAARAARGEVGVCEGVDYRGVPVLAALRAVPDSPWFMVAKVDQEEVYAPLRQQTWTVVVIMAALTIASCFGIALLWWRHDRHLIRQQLQSEQERRALAERIEHLMQSANDIILIADQDWRIVEANQRAIESYGYPADELRRMSLADLRAGGSRTTFQRQTQQLQAAGRALYETVHRRKDGSTFTVEVSARMVEIGGARYGLALIRDITLRKVYEREIERLNCLYATLSQINQSVVRVKTREQLFQEVCEIMIKYGRFQLAWIGRPDPTTHQVLPIASAARGDSFLDKIKVYADDRPEGRGPTGICLRENKPCISNDFLNDPAALPWREAAQAHDLRAAASFPIHFKGEMWGALTVYDAEPGVFQDKEVSLLQEAAMDISYAMDALEKEAQRAQAEAARERLLHILESSLNEIYVFDAESLRFEYVNRGALRNLGYTLDDLRKMTPLDLKPEFTEATFRQAVAPLLRREQPQLIFETVHRRADGSLYPVEVHLQLVEFQSQRVFLAVIMDTTERKKAQERARQAEEKYRDIFENAVEGIYQSTPDGRILSANPAMAAMHGYASPEDFIADIRDAGRQLYVNPARREEFKRLVEKYGDVKNFESEVRRKDGQIIWISGNARVVRDAGGKVLYYEGTVQDITKRKRAEESLRALSTRYEAILGAVPEIITEVDASRVYVWMNQAGIEFFGDDAVGKEAAAYFDGPQDTYAAVEPLFDGRADIVYVESWQRRRDGEKRLLAWRCRALKDANGNVTGALSTARDITEQRRMEQERAEMEAQMRQQQKLESIGTLASGIAHEINNPVMGIMNYAQLIADKAPPASPEVGYAVEIVREAERVAVIVKNLLQFSRHDKQSHSPARMKDIVEQTLSLTRTVMRHDQIVLETDIPDDLPALKCRSQQIQQVLMNLLTNARDALNDKYPGHHEDKAIRVSCRPFEKEGRRWLRLTVEDHGNGIPEAVRARVFDPFFTTKARDKGTGLGLSISHGIVREHHGELHFETETGRFTRFHVDLPVDNGWNLEKNGG